MLTLLKISISAVLIYYTLRKVGANTFLDEMLTASMLPVAASLILFLVSYIVGAVQWWLIMQANEISITVRQALSYYFIGLFFNNFLPSSLGGDVYRMIDIRRYSKDTSAAVSTVFLDRFAGFFIMSCLAMFSLPFLSGQELFSSWMQLFFIILPIIWILALMFLFNKNFARFLTKKIVRFLPQKLHVRGREIYNNIYTFRRYPFLALKILGIATAVQLFRISAIYLLALSLGTSVSFLPFLIFIPVIALAAALPVTLGGSGIREALGVTLFSIVTVQGDLAAVFLFMAYIAAIVTSLPGGIIFILRNRKIEREIR